MQKTDRPILGVSPSYFLSRYGESFGPTEVEQALPLIRALDPDGSGGLGAYEPEVFDPAMLSSWTDSAAQCVARTAADVGLRPSQFVAHLLGYGFESKDSVASRGDEADLARACSLAGELGTSRVVVPILPSVDRACDRAVAAIPVATKLRRFANVAARGGCELCVELVAGGVVSTTADLARLIDSFGLEDIGLNLDTGNAAAAGEDVTVAIGAMGERIRGTHLCEYRPAEGSSCAPEEVSRWARILGALAAVEYRGSYDVEVRCPGDCVDAVYAAALRVVREAIGQTQQEEL